MSSEDTKRHIFLVKANINSFINELLTRSKNHDKSKLESPEKEIFDKFTPLLKTSTYGTPEYFKTLGEMKEAIDHHYKNNFHHPEHYPNGIRGMSLIDIIEMFCDWSASTKRHEDGSLLKSIQLNKARFNYSDELEQIFLNTVKFLE